MKNTLLFLCMFLFWGCSSVQVTYDPLENRTRTTQTTESKTGKLLETPRYMNFNIVKIEKNNKPANYYFEIKYQAGTWLFMESVNIYIDDNAPIVISLSDPDRHLYESFYEFLRIEEVGLEATDVEQIKKIVTGKKINIRLNGKRVYEDFNLSKKEISKLNKFYEKYINK